MAAENRTIYWTSGSGPCWRALIALEEKRLPYESKLLCAESGGFKVPDLAALNPRNQVPTLIDGQVVISESLAAVQYLDDVYPDQPLMPKEKAARAEVLQRFHEVQNLQAKIRPLVASKKRDEPEDDSYLTHVELAKKELSLWDGYLKHTTCLGSNEFSIADIAFLPIVLSIVRYGATLEAYPHLKEYGERHQDEKGEFPFQLWRSVPGDAITDNVYPISGGS